MKKISALLVSIVLLSTFIASEVNAKQLFQNKDTADAVAQEVVGDSTQQAVQEVQEVTEVQVIEEVQEVDENGEVVQEVTAEQVEEIEEVVEEDVQVTEDSAQMEAVEVQPTTTETIYIPVSNTNNPGITDVPANYWASTEIYSVVNDGVIPLYSDGTFSPEVVVTRVDFTRWVLNALNNADFQITIPNNFSDINVDTDGYEAILRSDQIGLVYGYPNGTFQPTKIITKAETNSIMSHITQDIPIEDTILGYFIDREDIPAWATHTYEKTIRLGLYVNYPNQDELLPNKALNRAEAAVLLYKLRKGLNLVKKEYRPEILIGTEHLNVNPAAPANTVQVTDQRIIVDKGNVIKVAFASKFNSGDHQIGDQVHFFAKEDIVTQEGTMVFPAGTKFLARIESLQDPRWLNKNARMTIAFSEATLPCGKTVQMQANAFDNHGVLVSNHWEKPLLWTAGGVALGAGIGLAAGVPNDETGLGLAIGAPTGLVVGSSIGFLTPGVNFGASAGDEIYVLINEAFSIYNVSREQK